MPPPNIFDRLPPEDRAFIDNELRKRGFGDLQALSEILAIRGIKISKSHLGNYSAKLRKQTEAMRETAELANQIMRSIEGDVNDIGLVASAVAQQQILQLLLDFGTIKIEELDESQKAAFLLKVYKLIPELARGFVTQDKHKQELEKLLETAERNKDMTKEQFLSKVKEIYGVG